MAGSLRRIPPYAALEFLDLGDRGLPSCQNHLELLVIRRIDDLNDRGVRAAIARVTRLPYPRICHCGAKAGFEVL